MDEPITVDPADNTGADAPILPDEDQALPETQETTTAEDTANEQTNTSGADEALPDVDPKLAKFAKGQGIDNVAELSKREMALLKSAYDNKAEYERGRQVASNLEKTLNNAQLPSTGDTTQDQLVAEVQGLKLERNVDKFFNDNPEAKALEGKMAQIVTERPEIGQLVKAGYLSVSDLHKLAIGGDAAHEANLKTEGGREALKKVASKQQAKAVPGAATNSDFSPAKEDAFLSAFDKA